jgi:hypothetical protein
MSTTEVNELERQYNELQLRKIAGKPQHIEINERTIEAYKEEYTKKGLVPEGEKDFPQEDFHLVAKQKKFDPLVDPSQGIRKIIGSMIRQPVTIFDKNGKPQVKDALYFNGNYYGVDKRGTDLGAPFHEGSFKKPKLAFSYTDPSNPYDPKTGERRGQYKTSGFTYQYYIFLSEDKKERRKQLEDIIQNATGTFTGNLAQGHLHYRNPDPNNGRTGTHGGSFTWDLFCNLSIEELGELQQKNYYTEKSTGQIKDRTGQRVAYDHSTGKVEVTKDR